jgi:CHAT domain-containing protein
VFALADGRPATSAGRSLVLAVPDERAPLIEAEAREVAAALEPATLRVGADATLHALRSLGSSSRVVHIASHGYFRQDNPMFSAIRLGDGYLNVYDLYRLRLPAALVTLSGCATGQNVAAAGDEIIGISRGLLCAGACSLLLSLWDVHDEGTTAFMTGFYRALATTDTASAVRTAMLETKAHHPHPYYWAPFALVGKFRELR